MCCVVLQVDRNYGNQLEMVVCQIKFNVQGSHDSLCQYL